MKKKWFVIIFLGMALVLAQLPLAPMQAAGDIWRGGAEPPLGVGSSLSPYLISSGEHLKWFANQVNGGSTAIYGVLTADIRLNDTGDWQNWGTVPPANSWTPIGNEGNKFKGVFDGMGHTISGIYINSTGAYLGLFGYIGMDSGGTVKNLGVVNSYIKGKSHVGGVCGAMYFYSAVSGCASGATVTAVEGYAGGIAGLVLKNASLRDCRNTGNVTGGNCTGGIAGSNDGQITRCANWGLVGGNGSWIGGLVGMNTAGLTDSYNNGDVTVTGGNYIGGLCGANEIGGRVENAYTTGLVSGGWPVFGNTVAGSSFTQVYYRGETLNGGIGSHLGLGETVNKSAAQFASGEVAYLLAPVYGQDLAPGGDPLPVSRREDESNAVYRLTYMNGSEVHAEQYHNPGSVVSAAGIAPPLMEDGTYGGWTDLPDTMPAEDVTVWASAAATPSPPRIDTASPLPVGKVHQGYRALIEAAGAQPITFSLVSGALPPGLALDPIAGEITGTPTGVASAALTIRAQNDYGYDERLFILEIVDRMPGTGTMADPYQVWTADHLYEFARIVNSSTDRIYGILKADISLNDTSDWQNWGERAPANTWTPMGLSQAKNYKGGFDGCGHTISGIYVDSPGSDHVGFFGYVSAVTTIKNLNLTKSFFRGREGVGGICGTLAGLCKLENCSCALTVLGEKFVGGLSGNVIIGTAAIQGCANASTVAGNDWVGGIAGNNCGTISFCSNSGAISGSRAGGICGVSSGTLSNVFSTGAVSGDLNTGGLCGMMDGLAASLAFLMGGYSSGPVADQVNSAAICGSTNPYCTFSDCYYLTGSAANGIGHNAGGYGALGLSGDEFSSGEAAYRLGAAFGQTLGTDLCPVFRSPEGSNGVYRLLYLSEGEQHAKQYYNPGAAVSAAAISTPTKGGYIFSHWEGLPDRMPTADVTATAVFLPAAVPSAPRNLTATPGDGRVTLDWSPPASDGGAAIEKYQVSLDAGDWLDAAGAGSHTFTGLTNGQSYTFRVRAVNSAGAGPAASVTAAPQGGAPDPEIPLVPEVPRNVTATPGDGRVTLDWSPPADDGGAAIEKYQVSLDAGDWLDAAGAGSHTFTGLTNGQSYTFRVRAVNSAGAGPAASVTAAPKGGAPEEEPPEEEPLPAEYLFRELADSETGIIVSGLIHPDAVLSIVTGQLHDPSLCPACAAIRERLGAEGTVILFWGDLALSHGFTGILTVSIPLGPDYGGGSISVLHCNGGKLETILATVSGGRATYSLSSLSPLAALAQAPRTGGEDDIPKTGDTGCRWLWWLLLGLSGLGLLILAGLNWQKRARDS